MAVSRQDVLRWLEVLQQVYAENRQQLTELDLGHRRCRSRHQHGPRLHRGEGGAGGPSPTGSPLHFSERGDGPHPQRGRRRRAAIRHILPARRHGLRRKNRTRQLPMWWRCFRPASRESSSGVKPRPATRPCSTLCFPPWTPCGSALEDGSGLAGILDQGAAAAEAGMLATIPMQARKGRASYLGARSIGHQDPGATSSYLLLKAAADTWRP